jgi:hypothetical protein
VWTPGRRQPTGTLITVVLTLDEWTTESGRVTAAQKIQRTVIREEVLEGDCGAFSVFSSCCRC